MEITFKMYTRRDGSRMLYINRSNRVSVGISAEKGFAPYGNGTRQGDRNAYDAACAVIRYHGIEFTGDLAQHHEDGACAPMTLANGWILCGTDLATIGGMRVGSDGGYLIAKGMIVKLGEAFDEPATVDAEG